MIAAGDQTQCESAWRACLADLNVQFNMILSLAMNTRDTINAPEAVKTVIVYNYLHFFGVGASCMAFIFYSV